VPAACALQRASHSLPKHREFCCRLTQDNGVHLTEFLLFAYFWTIPFQSAVVHCLCNDPHGPYCRCGRENFPTGTLFHAQSLLRMSVSRQRWLGLLARAEQQAQVHSGAHPIIQHSLRLVFCAQERHHHCIPTNTPLHV
jgi:hypothetical protein